MKRYRTRAARGASLVEVLVVLACVAFAALGAMRYLGDSIARKAESSGDSVRELRPSDRPSQGANATGARVARAADPPSSAGPVAASGKAEDEAALAADEHGSAARESQEPAASVRASTRAGVREGEVRAAAAGRREPAEEDLEPGNPLLWIALLVAGLLAMGGALAVMFRPRLHDQVTTKPEAEHQANAEGVT